MMIDELLLDVETCLDEYRIVERLEIIHSLILYRDHMGLTSEQASRYAALLIRDSIVSLDCIRDLLHIYPAAIAEELEEGLVVEDSATAGKSSQG